MKKTAKQWYNTLPKELRELVPYVNKTSKYSSLSTGITIMFTWIDSKGFENIYDAYDFWLSFFYNLRHMEQLDQRDLNKTKNNQP